MLLSQLDFITTMFLVFLLLSGALLSRRLLEAVVYAMAVNVVFSFVFCVHWWWTGYIRSPDGVLDPMILAGFWIAFLILGQVIRLGISGCSIERGFFVLMTLITVMISEYDILSTTTVANIILDIVHLMVFYLYVVLRPLSLYARWFDRIGDL